LGQILIHRDALKNGLATQKMIHSSLQIIRVVDGLSSNNLTKVIMNALLASGGLSKEQLSRKLLCFGVDGVSIFQGAKIGVTKNIKEFWAPFPWVFIVLPIGQT
jgi:hypothetical protein